jgi:CBS domain containing-hemolysin-like protein
LFLALGVSFFCSILESVLLSVAPSYISILKEENFPLGSDLQQLKTDIDKPLAAILSLNTVAHTVGAAGVGAQALRIYGEGYVAVTSAILTLLILILSEIIPKTLGAIYWRQLIVPSIRILKLLIRLLYPFVLLSQKITVIISRNRQSLSMSREEIQSVIDAGYQEGSLLPKESAIIHNLMRFGDLRASDIMTPRFVIFALPADLTLKAVFEKHPVLRFSRIPVYHDTIDQTDRFVLKDDILLSISRDEIHKTIGDLSRDLLIVPETITLYKLFDQLLYRKESIALLVDEYGGVSGIVTVEDIVETLIGIEIMDETDISKDMQKFARNQWIIRAKKLGLISDKNEVEEWFKKLDSDKYNQT